MNRLTSLSIAAILLFLTGCGKDTIESDLEITGSMELKYAEQFSVDYCKNGCSIVTVSDDKYLIVPENVSVPDNTNDMKVIKQPVKNIYVAATSAMDLFDGIGKLDDVKMISTAAQGWSLPNIYEAVDSGEIEYIGKYSSPDYEALISGNCGLAVESTMIYHTPEVKEQIESFNIPVIVERSSYETHPLGRMEWIKLYGLLPVNTNLRKRSSMKRLKHSILFQKRIYPKVRKKQQHFSI